jgi:hypothetical protein
VQVPLCARLPPRVRLRHAEEQHRGCSIRSHKRKHLDTRVAAHECAWQVARGISTRACAAWQLQRTKQRIQQRRSVQEAASVRRQPQLPQGGAFLRSGEVSGAPHRQRACTHCAAHCNSVEAVERRGDVRAACCEQQ